MLSRLLTLASRNLSASPTLPCPIFPVSARATDSNLVIARTVNAMMQSLAGPCARSVASDASSAGMRPPLLHCQPQLLTGRAPAAPGAAGVLRQQHTCLAAQCCGKSGSLQQALPAARQPEPGSSSRPHLCGISSPLGTATSQHWRHNRHRWQHLRQLSAGQSFSIWSGRRDRSQDDAYDRTEDVADRRLLVNVSEEYALPQPLAEARKEQQSLRRELHTVNVAIGTNLAIFLAKLGVFSFTGSNALFAEAIHSLADVCNQALLWVGITRAKRKPTKLHPYGYMRDKFVFSLISAVGIFCLGAGVSVWHGCAGLLTPEPVEHLGWSIAGLQHTVVLSAVLGLSLVLEGASLLVAIRAVREGAEVAGLSFTEYVRRGIDPTSVAVMMEDAGACAGLIVAGACTGLVHFTGLVMWDSIGSICVGAMMGATAWFLISRNRQMLIGRSMDSKDMQDIIRHLEADPVVEAVYDAKSEEIGPGIFRFKAEIDFLGEEVVQRHMNGAGRASLLRRIQAASKNDMELDHALKAYGEEIINAVGAEVDRIETEIQRINPGVRYVDLETDRGQATTWPRSRRIITPAEVGAVAW